MFGRFRPWCRDRISGSKIMPAIRKRTGKQRVVLSYRFPGLWFGAIVLLFLGVSAIGLGIAFFGPAPPNVPGKPPPSPWPFLLIGGGVVIAGGGLAWLARSWSERYELDGEGIRWQIGTGGRGHWPWSAIQGIQLQDALGNLLLHGPDGEPTLALSNGLKNFEAGLASCAVRLIGSG